MAAVTKEFHQKFVEEKNRILFFFIFNNRFFQSFSLCENLLKPHQMVAAYLSLFFIKTLALLFYFRRSRCTTRVCYNKQGIMLLGTFFVFFLFTFSAELVPLARVIKQHKCIKESALVATAIIALRTEDNSTEQFIKDLLEEPKKATSIKTSLTKKNNTAEIKQRHTQKSLILCDL